MNISHKNLALAVLVLLVFFAAGMVNVDHSRPNYEFLPEMKYSPAYGAFEPNPVFDNGRTLQPPVAGTIARGEMPLHYTPTRKDAVRAGEELSNPYDLSSGDEEARLSAASSVQRGAELFRIYCVCCHGAEGMGDGPVSQRGYPPPPPIIPGDQALAVAEEGEPPTAAWQVPDGQLFHLITYGQDRLAPDLYGESPPMPSFAAQLTPDQRWDVINYIRSLQHTSPPAEAAPEPEAESPAP